MRSIPTQVAAAIRRIASLFMVAAPFHNRDSYDRICLPLKYETATGDADEGPARRRGPSVDRTGRVSTVATGKSNAGADRRPRASISWAKTTA
jgi:hypothetical protein